MENFDYEYLCKQLAISLSSTVRVFEGTNQLYEYSVWKITPDPVTPYLGEILNQSLPLGVITTNLFQFYTYLDVHKRYRFVFGPTGLICTDEKKIGELLLELGIPKDKYTQYTTLLRCPPTISLEKNIGILNVLSFTLNNIKPEYDMIYLNEKVTDQYSLIAADNMHTSVKFVDSDELQSMASQSYSFELMLMDTIRNGQVEKMEEINRTKPTLKAGNMAHDTLRQMKNESICGATVAARAAIEGGLDCITAFQISDIFIQKAEIMHHYNDLRKLQWELFVDYTTRVRDAKHGLENGSEIFIRCARYVQKNISKHISVNEIAKQLNLSRSYLCTLFKKETQITLTQYIQNEKILEAKRLLKLTTHSLLEISDYLAFSSQSHFQTVFKNITGMTPLQFRLSCKEFTNKKNLI